VRVSATGHDLVEHIRGALNQDVRGSALTLERRAGKSKRGKQKEQIAIPKQPQPPPLVFSILKSADCRKTIPRNAPQVQFRSVPATRSSPGPTKIEAGREFVSRPATFAESRWGGYFLTRSLSALPAWNAGNLDAAILIRSPV